MCVIWTIEVQRERTKQVHSGREAKQQVEVFRKSWFAASMFHSPQSPLISLNVITRSLHVHCMFTTRSLHVHHTCSPHVHCTFTARSLFSALCVEGAWPSNMNPSYGEHNNIRRAYEYAVFEEGCRDLAGPKEGSCCCRSSSRVFEVFRER